MLDARQVSQTFQLLEELGYDYVMSVHFDKWHAMLLDTWGEYAPTRCPRDLEAAVQEVCRRTHHLVVDNSWRTFRKRLFRQAPELGLDTNNL